jgi:acetyltransferase-like isoleucine patch superfamily enzyme
MIDTGVSKFGALVGDGSRIGANAVIAPGALLERGSIVGRLQLIDQKPED